MQRDWKFRLQENAEFFAKTLQAKFPDSVISVEPTGDPDQLPWGVYEDDGLDDEFWPLEATDEDY